MFPDTSIIDSRLRERSLGKWEGMHTTEVRQVSPEAFIDGRMDPRFTPMGGESFASMTDRISDFLTFFLTQEEPDRILVVSHNGWIRTAQHLFGTFDVQDIYKDSILQLRPIWIGRGK
jgi:broad specificity phosphatase PhoE